MNGRIESAPDAKSGPSFLTTPPGVSLPKGGGAIRGMGEKFAANPLTGTGSMSVPIATSPGRSGFGPQLSLSYDSGAGNGPFGFGWGLSLPQITRKSEKGLPKYLDGRDQATDSDVFILSGAEDLVPEIERDAGGAWVVKDGQLQIHDKSRTVNGQSYDVRRYRPRIEGLFARIERWTNRDDPADTFWRSISKDNVTTWYGKNDDSRIFNPGDRGQVFSWFICESHDDKGNVIVYRYKKENSDSVDLTQANEQNRNAQTRDTNRYLKRIWYGNRKPYLPVLTESEWPQPPDQIPASVPPNYYFEVVFDYDDGHYTEAAPDSDEREFAQPVCSPPNTAKWAARVDPFSTYRPGFEVRTYRLCQRVLMFHHFPDELGTLDYLVRSTDLTYSYEDKPTDARNPVYSLLDSVSQSGYQLQGGSYLKKSLPPVEFEYSQPVTQELVEEVNPQSLENLPNGLDGSTYRWTDLHGEGIPGILTEQAGGWFYKRNLSPIPDKLPDGREEVRARFAPLETVALKPNLTLIAGAEFMDLAGDGQPDVVVMEGPAPGLYEHDEAEGWQPFRPFTARLSRDLRDPNLKFVDLDGDGHADVIITEDDAFVWHASLAEEGFGPAQRVDQEVDEEKGPRVVFADGTQSIYLADVSGDGLTDLVRIRNGDVCYWPNLGYGRFGGKVTMDNSPWFDHPDQFDHKRIRVADIDGSGTTDIVYLHRDGIRLYFNQSGNSWSQPQTLKVFPRIDDLASIVPTDLLGNGTACLVWSSSLPGDARQPMRYVNLMGHSKPHLLIRTINNLGAETLVDYAPSTKFYLQDKRDGRPWITRLPFPVHVVERVETYDYISRNRFVTRHAYHHGYFDGEEREFRGFGMVEQWDTGQMAALTASDAFPQGDNIAEASHVPPVHTKTWLHTGVYLGREQVSRHFEDEYFRAPGLPLLLEDTELPTGLPVEEEAEACRALKGSMLRQEVYADDAGPAATADEIRRAAMPYTVTEQNLSIRVLQPRGTNLHAVFFTHAREAINAHYERDPVNARIQHTLTLDVDDFGNVRKSAAIGYGRRQADASLPTDEDRDKQALIHITFTENTVTGAITDQADHHRTPLPAESRTYEMRKPKQEMSGSLTELFGFNDFLSYVTQVGDGNHDIAYEDLTFTQAANDPAEADNYFRRLIEHNRTLYRPDDCGAADNDPFTMLPLGGLAKLALPGESYRLAFTPGLLAEVFQRPRYGRPNQSLLPTPAAILEGTGGDSGGYLYWDGGWWIPSGRSFFSANPADSAATELDQAQQHFFLPRRYRDPFGHHAFVDFDRLHDLLMVETRDALNNRVTVDANDYRVLQPLLISDANRNQVEVAFDMLGLVVGTAVMGKPLPAPVEGDSLQGFVADITQAQLDSFFTAVDPHAMAATLLAGATTRIVYDLDRFHRTRKANPDDPTQWQPVCAATLARETHANAPLPPQGLKIQLSFSYSDGFGREIQKKIQAEPGRVAENGPVVNPRWVGGGWTIFNNKGKPVRQYEPFFSATHHFEFGVQVGVSPVLFYDPVERVIATLHPNHTYEKVVFDPWQQTTYDVNDTCAPRPRQPGNPRPRETGDPRTDPDIGGYVEGYFATQPAGWQTWYVQRIGIGGALGSHEQAAATRAAAHADTPTVAYFDALGRPFLTLARNRVVCPNHKLDGTEDAFATRIELDIKGNQRAVRDANKTARDPQGNEVTDELSRVVMVYDYDMLGNRIYQFSMEAGERWMLNDAGGKPIRSWDSRDHAVRIGYDPLRRPVRTFVTGANRDDPSREVLTERLVYGEQHPESGLRNLRGKPYLHLDQAGAVATEAHDFKGNPLRASRRLAVNYKQVIDWRTADAATPSPATDLFDFVRLETALAPLVETGAYVSDTTYDALNRPTLLTTPHTAAMWNVIRPAYNLANLLEKVDVNLRLATVNGQPDWTAFVTNIDYDAKGLRQRIDYGNGTSTSYEYDPLTFRLVRLLTTRNSAAFPDDCPPPPLAMWPGCEIQNLRYTYDPAGNITHIQDDAQQAIYFKNQFVEPSNDYTYDAIYRLIEAKGREQLGQGNAALPHTHNDSGRVGQLSADARGRFAPNDGNAMGRYCEKYVYDPVGKFMEMSHHRACPGNPSWTRDYSYDEVSLIEADKTNNRLSKTTVNANGTAPVVEPHSYDAHGNMTAMQHLPLMLWDYRDQLQATAQQVINGVPETTYYVYDAVGQRVRKVTETAITGQDASNGRKPVRLKERIYLGGFEIYREFGTNGNAIELERETLHIMDDNQRIALVETRTDPASGEQLIRYQFGNHLGSAGLELDEQAQIISYEEYAPYGSSTYQAVRSQTETPKRYRYTGKEREESGFYYHGARYYAPWLGTWLSPDPIGIDADLNVYRYCRNTPVTLNDPNGMSPPADNNRPTASRPEDGPQLWAAYPIAVQASMGANMIFSPKLQELLEGSIRGPVLAASAPGVAATLGASSIAVGSYHLATGDYDKAQTAFGTALEVLPSISPKYALTANQKMTSAIVQSQLQLEREWVAASLADQHVSHTLHTNVARASAQGRVAADEFSALALKTVEGQSATQASRELGPVATHVVDSRYPNIEVGLNIQRGRGLPPTAEEMAQLREQLHPILRSRLDALEAHLAEMRSTGRITNEMERAGVAGTHSEIIALNKAIKAREALTNVSVTASDLADFVYVNRGLQGPFAGQTVPPPCYNCSFLIRGTTAGQ